MALQLILPIQPKQAKTFENFYSGRANEILLSFLKQFSSKKGEPFAYLWGNSGVGCTHLLQACCYAAHQQGLLVSYLPLNHLQSHHGFEILQDLENTDIVCIDELEAITQDKVWQEALFHFYNRLQANSQFLLIAAKQVPQHLQLFLPDLTSRLASGLLFQVHELSDEEHLNALRLRANLLGLELSIDVGQFLLLRLPRHAQALFSALDQLDQASLSLQRKLTIPFVKQVLNL